MGAASIVVERVLDGGLSMDEVLELDYEELIDSLGRDIIGNRTRHATLGLSTIKAAIRQYQKTGHRRPVDPATQNRWLIGSANTAARYSRLLQVGGASPSRVD
jgi:hypothetical protein